VFAPEQSRALVGVRGKRRRQAAELAERRGESERVPALGWRKKPEVDVGDPGAGRGRLSFARHTGRALRDASERGAFRMKARFVGRHGRREPADGHARAPADVGKTSVGVELHQAPGFGLAVGQSQRAAGGRAESTVRDFLLFSATRQASPEVEKESAGRVLSV